MVIKTAFHWREEAGTNLGGHYGVSANKSLNFWSVFFVADITKIYRNIKMS